MLPSYKGTCGPFRLHGARSDRNRPCTKGRTIHTTYRLSSLPPTSSPRLRVCQHSHCSIVHCVCPFTHPRLLRHPLYHATGKCDVRLTSVLKSAKKSKKTQIFVKNSWKWCFCLFLCHQCWNSMHEHYIESAINDPIHHPDVFNLQTWPPWLYLQLHFTAKSPINMYLSNCRPKTLFYEFSLLKQSPKELNVIEICFNHYTSTF